MPPPPPAPPVFYAFKDNETLVGEFLCSAEDAPPPHATPGIRTRHAKTPQPRKALISAFLLTSRLSRQLRHQGAARRRRQARQVHDRALRWFARRQPPRTRRPGERAVGQVVSYSISNAAGRYGPCLVFENASPHPPSPQATTGRNERRPPLHSDPPRRLQTRRTEGLPFAVDLALVARSVLRLKAGYSLHQALLHEPAASCRSKWSPCYAVRSRKWLEGSPSQLADLATADRRRYAHVTLEAGGDKEDNRCPSGSSDTAPHPSAAINVPC